MESDDVAATEKELGGIYAARYTNDRKRGREEDDNHTHSPRPSQTRTSPAAHSLSAGDDLSSSSSDEEEESPLFSGPGPGDPPAIFDPEADDVQIPHFDIKSSAGSDRHLVYDPESCSLKKAAELSKFSSPTCQIFTLRIPYDEEGGVLEYFQQFQAAYYLMWTASYLAASSANLDISTHMLVIKEDTYTSSGDGTSSLFDMIRDGVANKDYGFYFAEIHLHDDVAKAGFSDAIKNSHQLFHPREVKDVGPSAIMRLKESLKKHYSEAETEGLVFFQSREDFARGIVQLGQYQNTILSGQCMPKWAQFANIVDILQPFDVEKDNDDPPNINSCVLSDKFGILLSRENTFEKLLRPELVAEFRNSMRLHGEVFIDRYRAYGLSLNNIENMVAYKDAPGSKTHWITKLLLDANQRRIFHQETYINNQNGLEFLDELVLKKSKTMTEAERLVLVRRYWAGNHPLMEPYAVNLRETFMHMFKVVQAGSTPANMSFFVTSLEPSDTNGCRVGSIYLKQLWFVAEKFEFTCKLHSIRIVLQYLRDVVFFHEVTMRDPPGANLFGDAGGGKSHLFNIVKECSVNGMFEDCAWESRQGGLRPCGKKIKLNHEGKPSKQVRNGMNEAEMSLEKVGHSQGRREPLEIHRMGSDGKQITIRYKNLSRDWNALNIAKKLIAGPLLDRAVNKSTNAPTPQGRNVNNYVQAATSSSAMKRMEIAHDELRNRLYFFLAYDSVDALLGKPQDSELFSWIINQAGAHVNEFEVQGLLSGSRETAYAYLISRVHTLHTLVTVLFYDLAVPDKALLNTLRALALTEGQRAVVKALEGMCDIEEGLGGEILSAKPLPFIQRFMSDGDCYLAECLMFQTVDSIVLGLVMQTDPHMQNDILIVKSAMKSLCQNYGNEANHDKIASYKIGIDDEDACKYSYVEISRDQMATMIETQLTAEGLSRSGPTIESAMQFLYTHVVNDGANSTSSLAIKTSQINGAAVFIRKRLFNGILTRCEEESIKNITHDISVKTMSENNFLVGLYESDRPLWAEIIKRRLGVIGKTRMSALKRADFRACLGVTETELIVMELTYGKDVRSLFCRNRPDMPKLREMVAFVREDREAKARVESIRFYYDTGFGFIYVPANLAACDTSHLETNHKTTDACDRPAFWEQLGDRDMYALFRYITTSRSEHVWDFLSAEELAVVNNRQASLSDTGDLIVECEGVGSGADVFETYNGRPAKGVQFSTKRACFSKIFNTGLFSHHNDTDNFSKEGNSLTITRRVLGLFKTAGEQNKNPIHLGVQSMLKHLNITDDEENGHFFLNEPIEKGSLELGAVNVPTKDEAAKNEDIRMNNVGFIPRNRRTNMSKRMANSFKEDDGQQGRVYEKKGRINPEESANRAWFNKCRINKALRCPKGTPEEKKAAATMANLIYEKLASYKAVNRALRAKSKLFS